MQVKKELKKYLFFFYIFFNNLFSFTTEPFIVFGPTRTYPVFLIIHSMEGPKVSDKTLTKDECFVCFYDFREAYFVLWGIFEGLLVLCYEVFFIYVNWVLRSWAKFFMGRRTQIRHFFVCLWKVSAIFYEYLYYKEASLDERFLGN